MPGPNISKAGGATIRKVGHTTGKNHGLNPLATLKGESREGQATPITYSNK